MFFHCPAIDTSANNSDLEDEPVAPQHDEDIVSTHDNDNDNDPDANEDEDNRGNAVAGPTVLAHVDMAKTARKSILKFLYLRPYSSP
jgi:hypothetical protein